ncbi:MAG: flagellar biosynthetic protein FliO [Candidatus Devosia phytovorans]|uniref:Flagellar biosynthetic protein FliO n=1 Tax=Candidatus Devosia phytovorans TaxID=3121372 RepID=A0AAJ6B197_9HYPH|nr:flagellar biosynthetic protein FliO [Devosia sp.]WEK05556.1 MAG: flagellar biosynthetic protein FliO [Devosia sp.]
MNFLTSLFGGSNNTVLTAVFALVAVIAAILLVLWLLKLLFNATGNVTRGRNRRLAVIDSLALDPKRQLLIIRRDNVEHLILVGGAQDLLIEGGIEVEAAPAAQPSRRPIPTVPSRKPPMAPIAPQPSAQPKAPPATAIEQLQQLGQNTGKKQHLSLRHTGLLRPVKDADASISPENSTAPVVSVADSAKEDRARRDVESSDFVDNDNEANRK